MGNLCELSSVCILVQQVSCQVVKDKIYLFVLLQEIRGFYWTHVSSFKIIDIIIMIPAF